MILGGGNERYELRKTVYSVTSPCTFSLSHSGPELVYTWLCAHLVFIVYTYNSCVRYMSGVIKKLSPAVPVRTRASSIAAVMSFRYVRGSLIIYNDNRE